MENDTRIRFRDLEWNQYIQNHEKTSDPIPVGIFGTGGIGSHLAMLISRLNLTMYILDMDIVEINNISGQHFNVTDVGMSKVHALNKNIKVFSPGTKVYTDISAITNTYFGNDYFDYRYVFVAFDQITPRKIIFEEWAKRVTRELFIDGRMLAESLEIFFVQKGMEDEYRKYLYDDAKIPDLPCSAKATTHCGAMIASLMISGFTNYLSNLFYERKIRELPFKVNYLMELFKFTCVYDNEIQKKDV